MSEQTTVQPCCVSGHIHAGTPAGSFQTLHGLNTYVTGSGKDTVIFIPDIFGIYPNAQLLADAWATAGGWRVVIPDVFDGDAVPLSQLTFIAPSNAVQATKPAAQLAEEQGKAFGELGPWLARHDEKTVTPLIQKFVSGIKSEGGKTAAVGFCWGGRYSILLGSSKWPVNVDVAVGNHPSFLSEEDVSGVTNVPVAIFWGDKDGILPAEQLDGFEKTLTGALGPSKILVERYPTAVHGFTIRGDDLIDSEKKIKEDAASKGITFVQRAFAGQL